MLVTYKVSNMTYLIAKQFAAVSKVALPNHFDEEDPVPEFLQDDATVEKIGPALLGLIRDKKQQNAICHNFLKYHQQLKLNASEQAANEILRMIS